MPKMRKMLDVYQPWGFNYFPSSSRRSFGFNAAIPVVAAEAVMPAPETPEAPYIYRPHNSGSRWLDSIRRYRDEQAAVERATVKRNVFLRYRYNEA